MTRALLRALGLGLFMIAGSFLGASLFVPLIGSGPPEDTYKWARGIFLGAILGAAAWKLTMAAKPALLGFRIRDFFVLVVIAAGACGVALFMAQDDRIRQIQFASLGFYFLGAAYLAGMSFIRERRGA
jgi:hypothetical protein